MKLFIDANSVEQSLVVDVINTALGSVETLLITKGRKRQKMMFKRLFCVHYWIKDWVDNRDYIRGPGYECHCRDCGKQKWIKWNEVINYED